MTITIASMVIRAASDSEDSGYTRWTQNNWVDYFNDAIKEVCRLKSDAYTVRGNVLLGSGNIQALPSAGHRLIRPTRNMGNDGVTAGTAVRYVELDSQSDFDTSWYTEANATAVEDVYYDPRRPTEFFVSPPAPNYYLEIIYAAIPAEVVYADNFPLLDIYEMPAIYFAKGFAHMANRNDVDMGRAKEFMELGYSSLGLQKVSEKEIGNG